MQISVTPSPLRSGRIDFYENPNDYETGNATQFRAFFASPTPSPISMIVENCLEAGQKYYVRITHNQVALEDWKNPFKIKVEPIGVLVNAKALFEGPFDGNSLMNNNLASAGHLPMNEPYGAYGFTQIGNSGESISPEVMAQTGNQAVVDWVFMEIRDKNTPALVLATQSAVILRNGEVVDSQTGCPLFFESLEADDYYIALRHRTHLSVMTASPIGLRAVGTNLLDFSATSTSLYSTTQRKIINGTALMISGDANLDNSINVSDRSVVWNNRNQSGYLLSDVNLDGNTGATDRSLVWNNRNKASILP